MEMRPEAVSLLCDPITHESLRIVETIGEGCALAASTSGRKFPVRSGVAVLLESTDVVGQNQKYQTLYNRFAGLYDFGIGLFALLRSGGLEKRRREYLDDMEIREGAKVLEVSVGTGANLHLLPHNARYFGLDISWGMLMRCRKNLKRWGLDASLSKALRNTFRSWMACSTRFSTWAALISSTTRRKPCEKWSGWRSQAPSLSSWTKRKRSQGNMARRQSQAPSMPINTRPLQLRLTFCHQECETSG
jgi:uncharacterized protein YbaR (Trm112 family)